MADKDTPIYDKTRMRGTTWVDATRILFNMGSELEEQVDGINTDQIKQDLADEIINRQNADTQLGNRITAEQTAREQADSQLQTGVNQNKSDITQIKETINQIEDNATALGASVAVIQSDVAENKGNIQANAGKIEVLENEYAGFNSEQISLRTDLTEVQADVEGIKTSLVSDVITKAGSTVGTIMVELEREDGTKISAQDFNYGKPTSMELLQGSSEGMMKAQFTLSDGTIVQSNDFQVLEQITGDVYITSFTFKNGSSQGKISAVIGLSDGRTLNANDFQLPTDPQIQSNITDLLSRMNAVEEKNNQQDTNISALSTRMDTAESNIAGNDADIAQLKSEDETIKGDITSLDARVKAIEDTPGVGKFELGKLGTIMGSSDNGKISANPDGTGSVNGWDSVATKDELADYLTIVEAEADYSKKTDVSAIGITTSGNIATVNGKNANIVNSISGRVDENNNLILNVNGVESGGIPLPESVKTVETRLYVYSQAITVAGASTTSFTGYRISSGNENLNILSIGPSCYIKNKTIGNAITIEAVARVSNVSVIETLLNNIFVDINQLDDGTYNTNISCYIAGSDGGRECGFGPELACGVAGNLRRSGKRCFPNGRLQGRNGPLPGIHPSCNAVRVD